MSCFEEIDDEDSKGAILPPQVRKEIIKEWITSESIKLIAGRCRCYERTIRRDIDAMKESGEWWDFLGRAMS